MIPEDTPNQTRALSHEWELQERPFTSDVPILGPIIVMFRNAWSWMAAKWYVRPLVEQQNEYNRLFAELVEYCYSQVVEDARETSEVKHELAEITTLLISMNRTLQSFDERLERLESSRRPQENQ